MKALPAATASGNIHSGIIAGKLNGVIPATTPSGTRTEWLSTLRPTPATVSPIIRLGMPAAKSTTSMPRRTSPRASARTLPFSRLTSRASSSKCSSSRPLKRNIACARSPTGVARQAGKARSAASTAASTSPAVANGTRATTSPVAGS